VDFFVVGGVAAQLEGAPILTLDLDVLYDKTAENLDRLLAALQELKARYRDPAGRHIEPDRSKLETMRLHRLGFPGELSRREFSAFGFPGTSQRRELSASRFPLSAFGFPGELSRPD
jgi:hypothetical protein